MSIFNLVELDRLERLIKEKHPSWKIERTDDSAYGVEKHQIILYKKNHKRVCDVILSTGSYGSEEGLLEWWNGKGKPLGYITAEKALMLFEVAYESRKGCRKNRVEASNA